MSTVDAIDHSTLKENDEYLTFVLSDEHFAVPIMNMREIIEYGNPTPVPMVPKFIRGVINLRGSVVPIVDLAAKFGMPVQDVSRRTCIIILDIAMDEEAVVVGIVVDKILQVQDIPRTHIEPPPRFGAKIRPRFIKGMGRIEDRFVIILDVDNALSEEEISIVGKLLEDEQDDRGANPAMERD